MSAAPLHVLVVEDDPDAREILVEVLVTLGHRATARQDGCSALQVCQDPAYVFDAAILDLQMPTLDGIELLQRLRQDDRTRALPVVCVTARADRRSREAALAAGCDAYLTKPLPQERIVQVLVELLAGGRADLAG